MNRGKPTSVVLKVSGSTQVPLYLDMLHLMEDPVMEQEIFEEAVKMALSERIGGFDSMTVQQPSGNACDVELNLTDLCRRIESINRSYSHVRAHAKVMRELLQELSELKTGKDNNSEKGSTGDHTDGEGRHDEIVGILKELADRMVEDRLEEKDVRTDDSHGFSAVPSSSRAAAAGYHPADDDAEPAQQGFDEETRNRMGYAPLGDSPPPESEEEKSSNPEANTDANTDTDDEEGHHHRHRQPLLESGSASSDHGNDDGGEGDDADNETKP